MYQRLIWAQYSIQIMFSSVQNLHNPWRVFSICWPFEDRKAYEHVYHDIQLDEKNLQLCCYTFLYPDCNRWTDISSEFSQPCSFFIPWCVINPTYWVSHVVQQIVSSDSGDMTAKAAMHSKEASSENIFCGFSQAEFVSQVWVWQWSGFICQELLLCIMLQPLHL